MMSRGDAVKALGRLLEAEAVIFKQQNSGRVTKVAISVESKALSAIFQSLTGERPTKDELLSMTDL